MHIGFIGLGMMGGAMAKNLLRAGHNVTVYNRTPNKAEMLQAEGAIIAETPAEACKGDAVITCLADDSAVEAVVFGKDGIAGALATNGIHISMSTLSQDFIKRLAQTHLEVGQRLIAAPVFGRPDRAAAAQLLIIAAGEKEAIAQCQPLFDALGQRTIVVGENPLAASLVKLAGNFLLVSAVESLSEVVALLRKSGVDPKVCLDTLTDTLFAAPVYKNYAGLMLQQQYEPGFRLGLGLKDIGLVIAAAKSSEALMPTAHLLHRRLLQGVAHGYQDKDLAALALLCAEDAEIAVKTAEEAS
jgi:3-hydroxyisobutyrate dehydrogenase-like beta-hydroxyacid dehydrogenase